MLPLVDAIRQAVEALTPTVYFRYDVFYYDPVSNTYKPVQGVPVDHPIIRMSALRTTVDMGPRSAEYGVVLDYAEPSAQDLSDVPDIQLRAWNALSTVANTIKAGGVFIPRPFVLTPYHSVGDNREAGISLTGNYVGKWVYEACC